MDYFFILSGFGIYWSGYNKQKRRSTFFEPIYFAINKVKKIYIPYIISMAMFFPYFAVVSNLKIYVVSFGLDITLLQSLFPSTTISHGVNGPTWFYSTLFVLYMLCPVFVKIVKKVSPQGIYFLTMIVLALIAIMYSVGIRIAGVTWVFLGHAFALDIGSTPYTNCWYLVLGMIVARLYQDKNHIFNGWMCSIVSLLVLLFYFIDSYLYKKPEFMTLACVIDAVLASTLIYVLASGSGKLVGFFSCGKMKYLGKISSFIYFFHYPIIFLCEMGRVYLVQDKSINDAVIYLEFLTVIFLSLVMSWAWSLFSDNRI